MIQLLAVDDPRLLLILQPTFVRRTGWRVLTVRDADETLVRVRATRPDLVILDADGWGGECCRLLQLDAELAETPVILMASEPEASAVTASSPDAVVAKPVERSALLGAIRRFIAVPERAGPRRRTSRRVRFFHGDEERTGSIKDLGLEGLFLRCGAPPPVGERVRVIFDVPGEDEPTIRAAARVVRVVSPARDSHLVPGAGLRFVDMGVRDRADLAAFVGSGD